ncbi:ABC transporter substrate-binding protein [Paenibacillus alkalitolerans]|uniref:ABC transporter substrate-binding protein n=1 Tax=Paenibacillus alkalitolerans TaxID=2799335 RepID=UPI0018F70513|nr:ABC transporter substrate-binding protein [Paenibacillus alkalitolerans]
MLKKFGLFALALVMAFTLAACGSGSANNTSETNGTSGAGGNTEAGGTNSESAAAPDGKAKEKIVIKYWFSWGGKIEEAKKHLVEEFNKSQDRIEVVAEHQGTYDDLHAKVQAAFAAGNAPAVTDLEIASTGVFGRSGMLEDMTPFAERDAAEVNIDDFIPGLMGNSYVDGKLYGLPFMRSTPILYKNVTLLKDAGLDPAGPSTWEQFEEYARVLKEKGKTAITMPVDIWFYEAHVFQSGGQMLSEDGKSAAFNSPEGVAPVEFWKRLANESLIKIPVGNEAGATADKDWANQLSAFKFGSTAGVAASLEIAKGNNFELVTSFMPANKSYGVPTGGCHLVMTAKMSDEEKEAAWEFIKWMTSKENTVYQHKYTGYLPTRVSAVESEELQAHFKEYPQFKVAVDQLEYANARPMVNAYPEVAKIIKEAIEKAILDPNAKPQDTMNEAADKANKLLSK